MCILPHDNKIISMVNISDLFEVLKTNKIFNAYLLKIIQKQSLLLGDFMGFGILILSNVLEKVNHFYILFRLSIIKDSISNG